MKRLTIFVCTFISSLFSVSADNLDTLIISHIDVPTTCGTSGPRRSPVAPVCLTVTLNRDTQTLAFSGLSQDVVSCAIRNEENEILMSDYFVLTLDNPHTLNLYDLPLGVYTIILFLNDREYYGEFQTY